MYTLMKRKLIVFAGLILAFILFVGVKFFFFDSPGNTGRIKIVSSPTAGVFINSAPVGSTTFETRLVPGEYTIKLIPEGEDTKTVTWEGKVQVFENSLTYISREMGTSDLTSAGEILTLTAMEKSPLSETGQVSLVTNPPGAIVFLNNDEKGVSPIVLDEVPVGEHELAVYLPGFFKRSQKINVEKGHIVNSLFKLALDKTHKTLEQEISEQKKEATASADIDNITTADNNPQNTLTVLETPTGSLNVREDATVLAAKIGEVTPGDKYEYIEEANGWYKIIFNKEEGWVFGDFIKLNE
ncbi:hypothetical protein COV58_03750 [Candidatus Roizmanbacteria bacterium CG11_big_fil_rev_8_21_14_0_20_36_8]|uniref:SH3b domain-containing protein n=2 Tax=Candidatus Roizmaniibacteriota TaxID=1752723 RepID=A0A2M6ITJ9_9BACT|nr:MAG: hypothetical protein COV58_03750 [Candidatus Roizmanbacteria bacterium CG11_big_fil_rev_8_21_14_0_20_36_8]PIZ65052.1 MAG: hypothetical protein COY14_03200 [Candidatus Roizmanbacteria bacterium CG_4_10_14_0_2_um_filter_36_9]